MRTWIGRYGGCRGGYALVAAWLFLQVTKRFRAPVGRPSYFTLACPRKSNQRERHPDGAPSRHSRIESGTGSAFRVRGWATGFFGGTSCAVEKLAGIPAGHPAGFPPPTRRAIGAPGKAARSRRALLERAKARAKATTKAGALRTCGAPAFAFVSASGAHDVRLLFRGPSASVRRGRSGRAAGVAMDGNAFSTGQEARPKSPAAPHGLAGQEARQAPPRGGLLFWLLFSWPRKRKVTRAAAAARNCSETCTDASRLSAAIHRQAGKPATVSAAHFTARSKRRMKSRTCG